MSRPDKMGRIRSSATSLAAGCSSSSLAKDTMPVCETMVANVHSARAYVTMNFKYGANSPSRVKFSCYKCCALLKPALLQKRFREPNQLIRYQEFILPKSSLKELDCEELADETYGQPSHHHSCPALFSSLQIDLKKQVQDHQLHQPQNLEEAAGLSKKEIVRRRKIGAANKGNIPWTKGRKWSEEHKKLIRQRTAEALRNPKVRKKMLGHRQLHRQESKEKISTALRKIWENRIVSVKSRQKVLQIWSNSVAEAAKEGDYSQDKLDWDSYDRIKLKMISMFLWSKEREQIIKKLKKAVAKIVAKNLQAERKKIQARGTKKTKHEKLLPQKSDSQLTRVVVSTRTKVKERLTKWHGRKKELENVISSRTRKGGPQKPPRRQRTAEWRGDVDLVEKLEVP